MCARRDSQGTLDLATTAKAPVLMDSHWALRVLGRVDEAQASVIGAHRAASNPAVALKLVVAAGHLQDARLAIVAARSAEA